MPGSASCRRIGMPASKGSRLHLSGVRYFPNCERQAAAGRTHASVKTRRPVTIRPPEYGEPGERPVRAAPAPQTAALLDTTPFALLPPTARKIRQTTTAPGNSVGLLASSDSLHKTENCHILCVFLWIIWH